MYSELKLVKIKQLITESLFIQETNKDFTKLKHQLMKIVITGNL